jgi:hypothetical protein
MEARSREGVLRWSLVDGRGAVRIEGAGFACLVEALRGLTATDARLSVAGDLTVRWSRAGLLRPTTRLAHDPEPRLGSRRLLGRHS